MFKRLLILYIFVIAVLLIYNVRVRWHNKHKLGELGYVATVSHINPKTGVKNDFFVRRFLDYGKNYTRFEDTHGRIITFRGTEVEIEGR